MAALAVASLVSQAQAHKAKHTPEQLKTFEDVFMEQVRWVTCSSTATRRPRRSSA